MYKTKYQKAKADHIKQILACLAKWKELNTFDIKKGLDVTSSAYEKGNNINLSFIFTDSSLQMFNLIMNDNQKIVINNSSHSL